ncbi:MAG: ExbD/TolR family protein [Candidatus Methylomirabilales bacterium]
MALSRIGEPAGDDEVVAEINITPLTDVFLVLLIIFMVTSTALLQSGLHVNLPRSRATAAQPQGVTITLAADGRVAVEDQRTDLAHLGERLRAAFAGGRERVVTIRGDERVVLGSLVEIMDVARRSGAERIGVATRPADR